jgi:hypothetical protein
MGKARGEGSRYFVICSDPTVARIADECVPDVEARAMGPPLNPVLMNTPSEPGRRNMGNAAF